MKKFERRRLTRKTMAEPVQHNANKPQCNTWRWPEHDIVVIIASKITKLRMRYYDMSVQIF